MGRLRAGSLPPCVRSRCGLRSAASSREWRRVRRRARAIRRAQKPARARGRASFPTPAGKRRSWTAKDRARSRPCARPPIRARARKDGRRARSGASRRGSTASPSLKRRILPEVFAGPCAAPAVQPMKHRSGGAAGFENQTRHRSDELLCASRCRTNRRRSRLPLSSRRWVPSFARLLSDLGLELADHALRRSRHRRGPRRSAPCGAAAPAQPSASTSSTDGARRPSSSARARARA
jgi:hypothetical protein